MRRRSSTGTACETPGVTAALLRLADVVLARPRRLLAVETVGCLLLAAIALTVPVDMSFLSVLPQGDPLVERYLAMNESARMSHRAVLLLEGPEAALPGAVAAATGALEARPEVDWVAADPRVAPGARVVVASLRDDPMTLAGRDIALGRTSFSLVERAVGEVLADAPVTAGWAGVPPQTIQDIEATLGRFLWLSPLCLLMVLLLLRVAERRAVRLALIGAPMVLAVLATLGVSAVVFGDVTFNEGFFTVVVCGLGADFALHLVVRLREERGDGRPFEDALRRTLAGAGPPIVAGALTTAGAFAMLALAPETLPRRVGVTGAVGVVLCLGLMLTWLPAAWVLLERRASASSTDSTFRVPGLGRLAGVAARRPLTTVALAVAALACSGAGLAHLRYETDFNNIVNRDVPAAAVNERLQERFGANSSPWLVASDTVADAHRVHAAFTADPAFVRVDGAASLLPPTAVDLPPGTPPAVAAQVRGVDGRWLTWAYTGYAGLDTVRLAEDRRLAEAIDPSATGYGMFVEAVVAGERPWAPWIGLGILGLVLVVMLADLRSVRWVVLGVAPAVVGTVGTLGLLGWLDAGLGIAHVMSVPLLLGLGVDDGLHVAHRLREAPDLTAAAGAVSVGRAIVITTATTCASFAALALSNNPSLESMALVILIGLPLCLLASITLVPALAVLLRLR